MAGWQAFPALSSYKQEVTPLILNSLSVYWMAGSLAMTSPLPPPTNLTYEILEYLPIHWVAEDRLLGIKLPGGINRVKE